MGIWLWLVYKTIQIFNNLSVYFLDKYDELSELSKNTARYFITQQNGPEGGDHMKMNFLSIFKFRNEC